MTVNGERPVGRASPAGERSPPIVRMRGKGFTEEVPYRAREGEAPAEPTHGVGLGGSLSPDA